MKNRNSLFFFFVAFWLPLSTAWGHADYPIVVRGGDESSFKPVASSKVSEDKSPYDVVVIGGGLAGLSAAVYLTDRGKRILLLEKEDAVGGLAAGGSTDGVRYDRGAAYWTSAYEEEQKILEHIGIGNYEKMYPIPEPIDSYLWNGELYEGIWEPETLEKLPASFQLFRYELKSEEKEIPNQPFEEGDNMDLDSYSAADYIRSMPSRVAKKTDAKSQVVYQTYLKDKRLDPKDPMKDVVDLLDLYCRSALGSTADKVSAMAFANFYISEIDTRYTTQVGTAKAAILMAKMLKKRPDLATIKTSAPVADVANVGDRVVVLYNTPKGTVRVSANYAVFSAQLKMAPDLIEDFRKQQPGRVAMIDAIPYAHYSVHNVFVKGHPYRATYDTWTRASDVDEEDFTDVILGRWMDPKINGYQGMRDFSKNPPDENGILSIYDPLTPKWVGSGYTTQIATDLAEHAVDRLLQIYNPLLKRKWNTRIEVKSVITSRWPYSVHIPRPGHFTAAKELRKPFGRVFFANNNLGTPAFEEALFRGHCAANNILARIVGKSFKQETWSRCPLDR